MTKGVGVRQQQLLKLLLQNKSGMGIDALAAGLDISRTAVQQHIASLERDGYLICDSFAKTAGRPVRLYVLTEEGVNFFPKQYSWFSELLLDDIKETQGAAGLEAFMHRLGERTGKSLLPQIEGKSEAERIDFLVNLLEEMGYEAQAGNQEVDGSKVPSVEVCNCVYHSIAMKYEQVCAFDVALVSTVLGRDMKLAQCMAKGDHICQVLLQNK
ncbi:MAG: ArsR family transcriptional regulator [Gammaproteobacteria bacterium]|nr:MAG: ArsR family transcriptional regulator [Gammaproteobacteria bacterium]